LNEKKRKGYERKEALRDLDKELELLEMSRNERKTDFEQEKAEKKKKRSQNKEFAIMAYAFVGLFLALIGYMVYFQAVRSREIVRSPYNARQDSFAENVIRGNIVASGGEVLAKTEVGEGGAESRVYPYGSLFAHVVGFASNGKSGLESTENFTLLTSNAFFIEKFKNEIKDRKNYGDTVVTTLNVNLQKVASNALGNYKGAVIVLEPSTGKILAMVSKPDFDPNTISSIWDSIKDDENGNLLNRATQGQYAPGSTFKIVTALEYMRENPNYSDYRYTCTGEIGVGDVVIHCYGNRVHGEEDLASSFANSCNTSFSNIGVQLNVKSFQETAKELLFGEKLPGDVPYVTSKFQLTESSSDAEKMMTAMGQGLTQVSPYHLALITCAIANGGVLMKPYLVDKVTNYTGSEINKTKPKKYAELMTSGEAFALKELMRGVVENGTASTLKGRSYTAAGKTGTAEYSSDKEKDHSWFVGIRNVDNPDLVIAVIIEGSDGTARAVNVAKEVFDNY
jgi:peptidoglycan glycosyltransferase